MMRCVGIISGVLLAVCVCCSARTISVALDGSGEFSTIQAGIDAAAEGDVVSTAPGVYRENIAIKQKHGITIIGAGADVTVIDGGGNGHVVVFNVADGAISGFTITNSGNNPLYSAGIFTSQCTVVIEECVVEENNYGVKFSSNSRGTLCRSRVVNNCNVAVKYMSSRGLVLNNVIANNNRTGIECNSDVDVVNNTIVNNGFAGILCSPRDIMTMCNNIISSHEFGIISSGQNSISHLSISHNNCYGNDHNYWYEWGICCIPGDPGCIPQGESRAFVPMPGVGEMHIDPMFVNNNDYHLMSEHGRWDSIRRQWVYDAVTSPCIDAGDPASDWRGELWPHGGRVNMGAYGGTREASMSLSAVGERADLDYDEAVGFGDFGVIAREWGYGAANPPANPPHFRAGANMPFVGDLDRDGVVSLADLAILCERWW